MVLVLVVCAVLLALVPVGLLAFGVRRRLIQRPGGTFDCSARWTPPAAGTSPGKGWVYGVARYNGDHIEWFRVFSYAPRPRMTLRRDSIQVRDRRRPHGEEELALLSGAVVLACRHESMDLELAMSEDALTGFLAWLEAAPPGQRVNVA
ncbi:MULTISPECIES: DUF2550 domain-containing protein [Streptomyces]|uniref:DUF2550 domain-containing protein n=2 Tax=Streptomyces TaxID=1883 RepID=A0A7X6CYW7_9ACTN|nr:MULTISPECIES: DUF2550 domain-containing protein [Streptomyces]NJP65967.1 DUF2550 domain-containing protein [Streptomyces spiramenti]NJQ04969.1 DUF2550 domain-containing protein [Streptomyces lonarensis]